MPTKEPPYFGVLRVVLGGALGVAIVVNVLVVINHPAAIRNWGSLAIALYAADAEMGLMIGAIYALVFELWKLANPPEARSPDDAPKEITVRVYIGDKEATFTTGSDAGVESRR